MKKIAYSLLSIAVAFLSFSCAKNMEAELVNEEVNQPTVHTFICEFAQPDTKFDIANDGKTKWEVGDKILIHAGEEGNEREIIELTADDIKDEGKKAVIKTTLDPYIHTSGGVQDYTSTYYAIYPASATVSPTETPYAFQNKTLYYETRVENFSEPALAACDDGEGKFLFYNLFGVISYTVTGDFDTVVFSGNSEETVGYNVYQCRIAKKSSGDMYISWYKYGNGVKESDVVVKQTAEFSVNANGTATNYICIPKGVNLGSGFTMKFYKEGNCVKFLKTKTAINLERNKFLPLGNITDNIHDYVPPSHSEHKSAITGATDISAQQANCYVIKDAGAYKFPALKGNSSTAAGEVFGVELMWETYNNAEDVVANSVIEAVDFEDNWIYFKTPATLKPGNALIAAKDVNDKIIWSWHIWIPATTITSNTYSIYSSALMDRNLGALVAATTSSVPVESFGLHYEWGRKDPFVGALGIADNHFAKVSGTSITVGYEMTLLETIANPTQYAVFTATDSWGNWLDPFDNTLWQDDTKTMYDPCPVGYKVPKYESGQPWHSSDLSAVTGWSDNAAEGDNAAYFTIGDPVTVFPYCGLVCENGEYMDHLGARAFTWLAHASSSSGSGYLLDVRLGTSTHKQTSTVTSRGCSVRCVAIPAE